MTSWEFSYSREHPVRMNHYSSADSFIVAAARFSSGQVRISLAASSSPRPWNDIFDLSEKFNMTVTQNDLDPKVQKNGHNFLMTVRAVSWACRRVTKVLLILKKTVFDLNIRGQVFGITVQRNVPRFYMGLISSQLISWSIPVTASGLTSSLSKVINISSVISHHSVPQHFTAFVVSRQFSSREMYTPWNCEIKHIEEDITDEMCFLLRPLCSLSYII